MEVLERCQLLLRYFLLASFRNRGLLSSSRLLILLWPQKSQLLQLVKGGAFSQLACRPCGRLLDQLRFAHSFDTFFAVYLAYCDYSGIGGGKDVVVVLLWL